MSLIGNIKTLFEDKEKTSPIFPTTKVKAVSDDNNIGLNVLLDAKADKAYVESAIAAIPTPDVSGQINDHNTATNAHSGILLSSAFYAGTSAPSNTKILWIDTTASTGGLKYHDGSAWVHVPVAYT